jgi:hypothetical protein
MIPKIAIIGAYVPRSGTRERPADLGDVATLRRDFAADLLQMQQRVIYGSNYGCSRTRTATSGETILVHIDGSRLG